MSMVKWTIESVVAAVAVIVTTAGGIYSTSYHYGQVNDQVIALQAKVSKHDDQLTVIQQQNAAMQQSLTDIKDTVHDIQTQVRKPQHGNNQ